MDSSKMTKFQDVLCTDTPNPISFTIDWTIPNFSFFRAHTSMFQSSVYTVGKSNWRLQMCPLVKATGNQPGQIPSDSVSVHLCHSQPAGGYSNIRVLAKIGVVDSADKIAASKCGTWDYYAVVNGTSQTSSPIYLAHSTILGNVVSPSQGSLVDDKLILRAEVKYVSLDAVPSAQQQLLESADVFRQSFRGLHESKVGRDFLLVSSDGQAKSVHRAVLIARSPVFLAMFESKMAESLAGCCRIDDVSSAVLDVLVKFMYCGCLNEDIKQNTADILLAADKYQLTALVKQCEQNLIGKLTKETLADSLLLTDGTSAPVLRSAAFRFIKGNAAALKGSAEIRKVFDKGSAELVDEVIAFLLSP